MNAKKELRMLLILLDYMTARTNTRDNFQEV